MYLLGLSDEYEDYYDIMTTKNGWSSDPNNRLKYACPECPYSYEVGKALNGHMRIHSVTKCVKCEQKFQSRGCYHFHLAVAHNRRNRCGFPSCDYTTDKPEELVMHLMLHPENAKHAEGVLKNFLRE